MHTFSFTKWVRRSKHKQAWTRQYLRSWRSAKGVLERISESIWLIPVTNSRVYLSILCQCGGPHGGRIWGRPRLLRGWLGKIITGSHHGQIPHLGSGDLGISVWPGWPVKHSEKVMAKLNCHPHLEHFFSENIFPHTVEERRRVERRTEKPKTE